MNQLPRRKLLATVLVSVCLSASWVWAQATPAQAPSADIANAGSAEEALAAAQAGEFIRARESAEQCLRTDANSIECSLAMGLIYRRGEANFARARYWLDRALHAFEARYGDPPRSGAPWQIHGAILIEEIMVASDLEDYQAQLGFMQARNALYAPPMIAETAWPLMKLHRYDEARRAARLGLESGQAYQDEAAWNALCAIEFEAGNPGASYDACEQAMNLHAGNPAQQSAVDFTNFAEAARSVFRLDEAETASLNATRAQVAWFGNPYIDLAELYVREARFAEAFDALKQLSPYRRRRPVAAQESDRSESRRALASFFLVIGRGAQALSVAQQALQAPDRRGHVSRDPIEDSIVAATLAVSASREALFEAQTESLAMPWRELPNAWMQQTKIRFAGFIAGRSAARDLTVDIDKATKVLRIGTATSAVTPAWMLPDLVQTLGASVAESVVQDLQAHDSRRGARAYYAAMLAQAACDRGDWVRCEARAVLAERELAAGEELLRARMRLLLGLCAWHTDRVVEALRRYAQVLEVDPALFVRANVAVPVRVGAPWFGGAANGRIRRSLERFFVDDARGFALDVEPGATQTRICLRNRGAQLRCDETTRDAHDSTDTFANKAAGAFLRAVFSPDISYEQSDLTTLDGGNTTSRNPMDSFRDLDP